MTKPLLVTAAVVALLAGSGCCWPMHEWRGRGRYDQSYGRYDQSYDRSSEAPRPAPQPRTYAGSYRR